MRQVTRYSLLHTAKTWRSGSSAALSVLLFVLLASAGQVLADGAAVADGSWTKKTQSASGTWKIEDVGGVLKLTVSDDFKTKKAPDLKIFLSPLSAAEAQNKNATSESLFVAELPKFSGGFEVTLPAGTELDDYNSVLIHCEKYTKLWVAADL